MEKAVKLPNIESKKTDAPLALRYNAGKPRYDLIDYKLLEPLALGLEFGALKYPAWNWKHGFSAATSIGSLMRHLAELQAGNEYDEESGVHHIGLMMCNILFLAETYMNHRGLIDLAGDTKEFSGWIQKEEE